MNAWREAVIDELVVAHIYNVEHDTDPRKAIHDAIVWNVEVALDPSVSDRARALHEPLEELVQWWDAGYVDAKAIAELGAIVEKVRPLVHVQPRSWKMDELVAKAGANA